MRMQLAEFSRYIVKKRKMSDLVFGVGVSLFVLFTGTLVGKALRLLNFSEAIGGISFFGLILFVVWTFEQQVQQPKLTKLVESLRALWLLGYANHQAELQKILEKLEKLNTAPRHDWLYTSQELETIETMLQCRSIWVFSPDLVSEARSLALRKNIQRGVRYTYIIPEAEDVEPLLPRLYRFFEAYPQQLRVVRLPQNMFRIITTTHLLIYNPNMERGETCQVFWELPIRSRRYGQSHWIKVADEVAQELVERFRRIIDLRHRKHLIK